MTDMTDMTCSVCGDPIEYGELLPFRHTNGLRPNVRPHYAGPVPASRSGSHDLAGAGALRSRDAAVRSEAPDKGLTSLDPAAGDRLPAAGIATPHLRPATA